MTIGKTIAGAFTLPGHIRHIEPLGKGLINDSYLVTTPTAKGILQRINADVFPSPGKIMANLRQITDYLARHRDPGIRLPGIIPARDGKDWVMDKAGGYWRMLEYIEDSENKARIENLAEAEILGESLGRLHCLLAGLVVDKFHVTLPGFHVTPNYLARLDRVLATTKSLPADVRPIVDFIQQRREQAPILEDDKSTGELPLRIIHGDPKLDNVLFFKTTGEPMAWVDLDTIQPGLVLYDIGDCIRSACRGKNGRFDLDTASAVLKGWFREAKVFLTPAERHHVPDAISLLPYELGIRFLTDYLEGNRYFKVSYREENLHKAQKQFELLADIEKKSASLQERWENIQAE